MPVKKNILKKTIILFALLGILFAIYYYNRSAPLISRTIRYSLNLTNTGSEYIDDADLQIFAPRPVATLKIVSTPNFNSITTVLDSTKLEYHFPLKPFDTKIISVEAVVTNKLSNSDQTAEFLVSEILLPLEDKRILDLAKELAKSSRSETSKASFEWVKNNLTKAPYSSETKGALTALEEHKGDCTEMSYLLTALLRANKIPARVVGGFVVLADSVLRAEEYHNWVEFYEDGVWQIADPFKDVFKPKSASIYLPFLVSNGAEPSLRFSSTNRSVKMLLN